MFNNPVSAVRSRCKDNVKMCMYGIAGIPGTIATESLGVELGLMRGCKN